MLALFETLFDIIRLRKGPDAIPYSPVVFALTMALWLAAGLVMTIMTPQLGQQDFLIGTVTGLSGLGCYAGIVLLTGNRPRLLQTVTAILMKTCRPISTSNGPPTMKRYNSLWMGRYSSTRYVRKWLRP